MSLKKVDSVFQKISYRLAAAYMLFFIPCYLLTFGSFYYLTERYLRNRDRDLIESKIQFFESLFQKEGAAGLEKLVSDPLHSQSSRRYFIQVSDKNHQVVFFHLPETDEPINSSTLELMKNRSRDANAGVWFVIPPKTGESDSMEMKTVSLDNNFRLSVGASTDDREDLLEAFHKFFLTILSPLLFISLIGSIYISHLVLRPLSILAETIQKIRSGTLSSRAKIPRFKDELYHLSIAFNQMISQIESLIQAMKDNLDNIAHDIKTPLTRSRVSAELALQSEDLGELKTALEENIENTDSLLKMVDTIMTVAEFNAKTLQLKLETFDGKSLLEEVMDLYTFVAEEKEILVQLESNDFNLFADRNRIKQIIANLVDNAIKYSPAGSVIKIFGSEAPDKVTISIIDHGIGISESETEKIWERLYRGDKSRHEPGLGLGLSIVKALVDAHGGSILALRRPDGGTEFRLELPKV